MATCFSFAQILEWSGGRHANARALEIPLAEICIAKSADLIGSTATDIAYFFNLAYKDGLAAAAPGILITGEPFVNPLQAAGIPFWKTTAVISCKDPYLAMAVLSEKFAAAGSQTAHLHASSPGIHATAVVAPGVQLDTTVTIGAHCVIEGGATIGTNVVLYPGVYIGKDSSVGNDSILFMGVKIYAGTRIGERVRIHANAVLGADGFGYAPRFSDGAPVGHQKIHHSGAVVVGDDVEIGANTCIDRGTFGDTRIERDAKIDNLVMIGHNCHIGRGAIICGNAGLSGNSSVGNFAYVGGASGLSNLVHVGDFAKVGGMSLITKDVPEGTTAAGNPQREIKDHFHVQAMMSRMSAENQKRRKSGRPKNGAADDEATT